MTPTVASTFTRVDSSACGTISSLGHTHGLDETQAEMAELDQFRLAEAVLVGPPFHQHVHLLSEHADSGQRLGPRVDSAAGPRQDLPDARVEQVAVGVPRELRRGSVLLKSEGTHIFVPHYPIPQQKTQAQGRGGVVTRGGSTGMPALPPTDYATDAGSGCDSATGCAGSWAARLRAATAPTAATSTTAIASAIVGRIASTNAWVNT